MNSPKRSAIWWPPYLPLELLFKMGAKPKGYSALTSGDDGNKFDSSEPARRIGRSGWISPFPPLKLHHKGINKGICVLRLFHTRDAGRFRKALTATGKR